MLSASLNKTFLSLSQIHDMHKQHIQSLLHDDTHTQTHTQINVYKNIKYSKPEGLEMILAVSNSVITIDFERAWWIH